MVQDLLRSGEGGKTEQGEECKRREEGSVKGEEGNREWEGRRKCSTWRYDPLR
jgi:hypothetical protein